MSPEHLGAPASNIVTHLQYCSQTSSELGELRDTFERWATYVSVEWQSYGLAPMGALDEGKRAEESCVASWAWLRATTAASPAVAVIAYVDSKPGGAGTVAVALEAARWAAMEKMRDRTVLFGFVGCEDSPENIEVPEVSIVASDGAVGATVVFNHILPGAVKSGMSIYAIQVDEAKLRLLSLQQGATAASIPVQWVALKSDETLFPFLQGRGETAHGVVMETAESERSPSKMDYSASSNIGRWVGRWAVGATLLRSNPDPGE